MRAPCAGVPLPGGSPVPSGRMLMSQAAISAEEIGFPRFGPSPGAALSASASMGKRAATRILCVDMFYLAIPLYSPAGYGIDVLVGKAEDVWNRSGLTTAGNKLRAGR